MAIPENPIENPSSPGIPVYSIRQEFFPFETSVGGGFDATTKIAIRVDKELPALYFTFHADAYVYANNESIRRIWVASDDVQLRKRWLINSPSMASEDVYMFRDTDFELLKNLALRIPLLNMVAETIPNVEHLAQGRIVYKGCYSREDAEWRRNDIDIKDPDGRVLSSRFKVSFHVLPGGERRVIEDVYTRAFVPAPVPPARVLQDAMDVVEKAGF